MPPASRPMSPPAPPTTEPPRRRRLPLPPFLADPESRSVQIAVLATLLLHLLLFLLAPHFLKFETPRSAPRPHARPQQFNIRVIPPAPREPPRTPPPMKFVEANPNAPANTPDKTNNFSFMNQQAAQEKPTPNHKSDMPATEGRKDVQSNQIVTGNLSKPQETVPPTPQAQPEQKPSPATPRREQNPLPGFEKDTGANATGFGMAAAKPSANPQDVPNKVEGAKDAPPDQATANANQIDPQHPRPRPTLQQVHTRPAIFAENKFGTENMGITALDARFNNYGVYLHRMLEIIQVEWDRIIENSRTYPPSGTSVTVRFRLDSSGKITEIIEHKSNSSEQGTNACISAITNPSPYDKWTPDMISVLGNDTELGITFYYE